MRPGGDAAESSQGEGEAAARPQRRKWVSAGLGLAILAATAAGGRWMPALTAHFGMIAADRFDRLAVQRQDAVLAGVFLGAWCLMPIAIAGVGWLRGRWRDAYTWAVLAAICAFLWTFVVHFGRWQFGAYDYNIAIELGWRQMLGQRPYVDFPATTPPGFNLGLLWAFRVFGASWNAELYLTALFTCTTFVWMYWLLRRLELGRAAAGGVALAIEGAAMLTLCFWWYNNSALVLAAVFLLSCVAYASAGPEWTRWVDASYCGSLALLALMKPNIAGLTIVGGVCLLYASAERRRRLTVLTLVALAAVLVVLALNHVPMGAMLRSYGSVAEGRGGVGARFGYRLMSPVERRQALLWLGVLALPLLGMLPTLWTQLRSKDRRGVAFSLLFPLGLAVALYGLATNGDYGDLECTVLLAAGGVVVFGLKKGGGLLRRAYVAVLCAGLAGDVYYGAMRMRVFAIGQHLFFEWQDNQHRIERGFLKDMRVSGTMIAVEDEVQQALAANPGPYFFGPRVDFNYAVFGLASPEHFPAWWHPGTAFGFAEQAGILRSWEAHRFATLIFVKTREHAESMEYTYYPPQFLDMIAREYVRDGRYADITVYRRRVGL